MYIRVWMNLKVVQASFLFCFMSLLWKEMKTKRDGCKFNAGMNLLNESALHNK